MKAILPPPKFAANLASTSAARRRGWTLVEVVVAATALSTLLAVVATCLHTLHRADRALTEQMEAAHSLSRLSLRMREDVHGARAARIDAAAGELVLALDDEAVVSFKASPGQIRRTAQRGETIFHKEVYRLPDNAGCKWEMSDGPGGKIVMLIVVPVSAEEGDGEPVPMRIEAAITDASEASFKPTATGDAP